jgi:hypothetical protein
MAISRAAAACALVPLFLAGCERARPPLEAGTDASIPEITTNPPVPPTLSEPAILFTVRGLDGTGVAGATVRVYTGEGPVATALSDEAGLATVHLPQGRYCATARVVPVEWLELDIVVPPTPLSYSPAATQYGPVVRTGDEWVPFTPAAFEECYLGLPIVHEGLLTDERVDLPAGFNVHTMVMGLDGQPMKGVDVYAVIPVDVPWRPADLDPEVKTGFFTFVNQTNLPANVVVSPNTQFALEYQATSAVNGFNLTASAVGMAGSGGGSSTFVLSAAPLMCVETVTPLAVGENGLDYVQIQAGYHASLVLVPDPGVAAVQIKHTGNGKSTIDFRVDLVEGRRGASLTYACEEGSCSTLSVEYSDGSPDGLSLQTYYHHLGRGAVKTTVVLMNIPATHERVLFRARSAGDRVPAAQEGEGTYILMDRPAACSVQSSNDDRWAIGVM